LINNKDEKLCSHKYIQWYKAEEEFHISDVTKLDVLWPNTTQILYQLFYFDCFLDTFPVIPW